MSNDVPYEANLPDFLENGVDDSTKIHESVRPSELVQIADEVADESVEAAQFLRELAEGLTPEVGDLLCFILGARADRDAVKQWATAHLPCYFPLSLQMDPPESQMFGSVNLEWAPLTDMFFRVAAEIRELLLGSGDGDDPLASDCGQIGAVEEVGIRLRRLAPE